MEESCFKGRFCSKEGFDKIVMLSLFQHPHLRRGFTLIELLVVVLIIGILAAVAVPRYNKAVIQSRFIHLKLAAQRIATAQEIYYLANGHYADSLSKLDINFPMDETNDNIGILAEGSCANNIGAAAYILCVGNSKVNMSYQLYYAYSSAEANNKYCIAKSTDLASLQNQICKKETNRTEPVSSSDTTRTYWRYN